MSLSNGNMLVLSRANAAFAANPSLGRVPRLDRPSDGRSVVWHHPDWRYRQATLYNQAWASSRARGGPSWQLPEWEDDEIVQNLFVFMATGSCDSRGWKELMSMALQIHDSNHVHGIGSRIKAYTVAGLVPDEISEKFALDLDAVRTYLDVFFDVERSLSNRNKLATLVSGFATETERGGSVMDKRESSWISMAFLGGPDMLDLCTCVRSDGDDMEDSSTARFVFSQMSAKAAEAAASLRMGDPVPKKANLEFYLEMNDVKSRIMQAQAQMASIEDERGKDDGYRRMKEFVAAIASESSNSDFLEAAGAGAETPSLDSLRTEAGRIEVEKMLGLRDSGGVPSGGGQLRLPGGFERA